MARKQGEHDQPQPAEHQDARAARLNDRVDDAPGAPIRGRDLGPPAARSDSGRDPARTQDEGEQTEAEATCLLPTQRAPVWPRLGFPLVARILLLGSTGFFGRGVAHKLIDAGHQLRVLVRDPLKAAAFKGRGAQLIVGDALNPTAVGQAAQGTDHIISLVAVRRNKPQSFLEVNVDGPRILGQAAQAAGAKSVVFVSVIGARLDPKYKYLTSRWMGEQELSKTGVRGTILRFSYVLAEEGGILAEFERVANFGPFLIIPGSGQAQIQPILREDAARCVVEAIDKPDLLGKIVELGGPEVVTYETMFGWFVEARGIKKPIVKVPPALLIPGAAIMEVMLDNPIGIPDEIKTVQLPNIADGIDSVSTHFGWRPSAPSSWVATNWRKGRR